MTKRILLIFVCLLLISPVLAEKQQEPDFYNKGATRTLNPTTKTTLLQSLFSPQSTTQQVLAAQNLDRDDLTLTKIQSIDPLYKYQPKGITHTSYKQIYQDIPVFNSYVGYTEINGKPTLLKTKYYDDIEISTSPEVSQELAIATAQDYATTTSTPSSQLIIYPTSENNYKLAYKVDFPTEQSGEEYEQLTIFVSAQDASILGEIDNLVFDTVSGQVVGSIFPEESSDEKIVVTLKNNNITTDNGDDLTDINGNYQITDSNTAITLTAKLEGLWAKVNNAQQTSAIHTASLTTPTTHNFNWSESDNSYKQEETNAFYHTNIVHDFFTNSDPINVPGMNFQMPVNVNLAGSCNAFYDGSSINFYAAGGGCDALSLSSDVVYHEYVHAVVDEIITIPFPYWDQTGNMNEGWSDYFACHINNDTCLSAGFAGRDCLRQCNTTDRFPEDYHPEPHSGTQIFSGAMWDLKKVLGDNATNDRIINAMRLQPELYSEFLENLLIVDDNNSDLGDGTPNIAAICNAFVDKHGIQSGFCAGYTQEAIADIQYPDITTNINNKIVDVNGSASSGLTQNLINYTVEFGVGSSPSTYLTDGIVLENNGQQEVSSARLATWNTTGLGSGTYTLRLTLNTDNGTVTDTQPVAIFAVDEFEPDNTPATATLLPINGTIQTHSFVPAADVDYMKFDVTSPQTLTLETHNLLNNADTYMTLYDTDGTSILGTNDDGGVGLASKITYSFTTPGTYFVGLRHFSSFASGGIYDINITQHAPPAFLFTGNFFDRGVDTDGNGLFNELRIDVEVQINQAGEYELEGELENQNNIDIEEEEVERFLSVGTHNMTLVFDAKDIYEKGFDGPYVLDDLFLENEDTGEDIDFNGEYTTNAYNFTQFERPPVITTGDFSDQGIDSNGNGLFEILQINVGVNSIENASYFIDGTIVDEDQNRVADAFVRANLPIGNHTIQLNFSGIRINIEDKDGPYQLKQLNIFQDLKAEPAEEEESLQILEAKREEQNKLTTSFHNDPVIYNTTAYNAADFEPQKIFFLGNVTESLNDSDGNGLFNYLNFHIPVNITLAGLYEFDTVLTDHDNSDFIGFEFRRINISSPGIYNVTLPFAGEVIRGSRIDGPYEVEFLDIYDVQFNYGLHFREVLTTIAHNHTSFELSRANFTGNFNDFGVDRNGNSLFDNLVIDTEVEVIENSTFDLYGRLCGGSIIDPEYIDSTTTRALSLDPGIYNVSLNFSGNDIYDEGLSGAYFLCEVELEDRQTQQVIDQISNAYTTSAYNFTDFDPFVNFLNLTNLSVEVDGVLDPEVQDQENISIQAHNGSNVTFYIELTNIGNFSIFEDVEVMIEIEDIDNGDDLDQDLDLESLSPGETTSAVLTFILPSTVPEALYEVNIRGHAEENSGQDHEFFRRVFLQVVDLPPEPEAILTATPDQGQEDLIVFFNCSHNLDNGPFDYEIRFKDGFTVEAEDRADKFFSINHVYTKGFVYNARCDVENALGQSLQAFKTVNVTPNIPKVDYGIDSIVNVSDDLVQVELFCDGDDGDQPYNFSIDFGDGSNVSIPGNNSDDVTVFHNYTIGLFYSNCTIHDADGDVNISETIMINTSKPDFTPGFTVDLSLDSLTELNASNIATANFTCDVNGGSSPYSYGLNPGDGSGIGGIPPTTQDTISFSHDYSIGLFTANCTVIDNNSVMNISNNVIINISQPPPPGLIASLAIDSIQETQNSTFIVNSTCSVTGGTPLFSYGFDPGDNSGIAGIPPSSSTSAAFSHEYAEGLYTTNCSVTDGNSITNRSANILLNLTPTPIPAIRVATLTANVTHGDAPLSVGFNCSLENVTIPVQYGMNFGDGLVIVSPFSINNLSRLFNHTYETGFFNAQCAALDDDGVQVYSNFINITVTKPQNNAPIINSFFPSDTTPTIAESTSQLFNISASDPDLDNLSINFFVDNALVNSPTSSFIFNAPDVNESEIYFIRAEVSDGNLSVTQYWNLTVTPVPISDVLDGNTTNFSELPDIERADNVTLENQVSGRINFLETLNLSQVGDLDNSVVISNNLVSINSDALPQLNRSARITLRGLSYTTTPVIFFNEGFTTNPNEVNTPCDFCTLISFTPFPTTDGEVIFEVEHFSSFAVGQNQSTPTPAEPVIKKTKKDEFKIERLRLSNEVLQPGDTLVTATNIKNVGDKSTKTGKVTVVIPELGLRKRIGPFKVGKDDDILKQVALELPKDTPPGEYVVRITVSSQKERRVKHRFIRVD